MAVASFPASLISRSTVLIVDCDEFGSGGKGWTSELSLVDFAATTTGKQHQVSLNLPEPNTCVTTYHRTHS